jgi:hypothetical protein
MTLGKAFLGLLIVVLICGAPVFGAGARTPNPGAALTHAIQNLDREASTSADSPMLIAFLIQKEYGTREEELKWGMNQKLSWGEITVLAYIQATTGKTFAEMAHDNAPRDFWSYAENAGMNCAKMAHSLDGFLQQVERERNSQIFDKLRASRRVHSLPDLGNGFGLFQEALDFRRIDSPNVNKVHDIPGELSKGEK